MMVGAAQHTNGKASVTQWFATAGRTTGID